MGSCLRSIIITTLLKHQGLSRRLVKLVVYRVVRTCDIFSLFRLIVLRFGYCLMVFWLFCFLCFASSMVRGKYWSTRSKTFWSMRGVENKLHPQMALWPESNPGHIGGRGVISPPRQPCYPYMPLDALARVRILTRKVWFPICSQPTPKAIPHEITLDATGQIELGGNTRAIGQ